MGQGGGQRRSENIHPKGVGIFIWPALARHRRAVAAAPSCTASARRSRRRKNRAPSLRCRTVSCPLGVNKTCNKTPQQVQLAGPTRVTRVAMDRANAIAPASPTCGAHCCGFLPGGSRSCHIARRRTCRAAQSSPTSAGALRTSGHGRSFAASSTAPRVLSFGTWCWGCGLKRNRTKGYMRALWGAGAS